MKLGASVGPVTESVTEIPEDFDFVELAVGEMEIDVEEIDFDQLEKDLEDKELELVLHLPFRQPLVTTSGEFNQAVVRDWRNILEAFSGIGVEKAVVHCNYRHGEDHEKVVEKLEKQVERVKQMGQELDVEICFENVGQFSGTELFELGAILDETGASMCFDTGHAFSEVGQEEMEEFLEEYSHIISHLHAQDTREGKDMHISIGEGEIDFKAVGEKLQGFDGTVTLEIYAEDPDYFRISRDKLLQHF